MMTVTAIMAGLLPILWRTGTGSELMQRIAVPMVGGMVSSTVLTLLVIPAIYGLEKGWRLPRAEMAQETKAVAAAESRQASRRGGLRPCRCSTIVLRQLHLNWAPSMAGAREVAGSGHRS